jgi:hypothetical protein
VRQLRPHRRHAEARAGTGFPERGDRGGEAATEGVKISVEFSAISSGMLNMELFDYKVVAPSIRIISIGGLA